MFPWWLGHNHELIEPGLHVFRADEWIDIGGGSWPTPRMPTAIHDHRFTLRWPQTRMLIYKRYKTDGLENFKSVEMNRSTVRTSERRDYALRWVLSRTITHEECAKSMRMP